MSKAGPSYLLLVDDETRQGALRFAEKEGGPFLHQVVDHRTPPQIELPALLAASEHVYDEVETADDLRLLLAPGSSLGGARPKASVRDRDGSLAIAKFPHHADRMSTVLWEALALRLASAAGINAATGRVERVAGRPVFRLQGFDRDGMQSLSRGREEASALGIAPAEINTVASGIRACGSEAGASV